MKTFEIQPTSAGDVPALMHVLDQTDLFPSQMLADMIAPALAGETEAFWLTCHVGGQPVGFTYTEPEEMTDRTWNLLAIAVLPTMQQQGFGAALVRAVEAALRRERQRLLLIETSGAPKFDGVHRFYKTLGYAEIARIPDFWADGDDKVIFCKALS